MSVTRCLHNTLIDQVVFDQFVDLGEICSDDASLIVVEVVEDVLHVRIVCHPRVHEAVTTGGVQIT